MKTLVLRSEAGVITATDTKKVYVYNGSTYTHDDISLETLRNMEKRRIAKSKKLQEVNNFLDMILELRTVAIPKARVSKSDVMRRAWKLFKAGEFTTFSQALTISWHIEKNQIA